MSENFSNLRQKQRQTEDFEQAANSAQASRNEEGREFKTVEDLLRYDSEQNPVPGEVAERVNNSLAAEPPRARPWWKRLFG